MSSDFSDDNINDNEMYDQYSADDNLTQDDMWGLVSLYFHEKGLVYQQLKSFNMFVNDYVDEIVQDQGIIEIESKSLVSNFNEDDSQPSTVIVKFGETVIHLPYTKVNETQKQQLTPYLARLRGLTYHIEILAPIEVSKVTDRIETVQSDAEVCFVKVPTMVRSEFCTITQSQSDSNFSECECDPGGYFIVNGSEKVIIGQEHMVINKPICFSQKSIIKYDLISEIRSQPAVFGRLSQPFNLYLLHPSAKQPQRPIHAKLSKMERTVPLMILFRALNVVADKEILEHICYDPEDSEFIDMIRPSIDEGSSFADEHASLDFIGKRCSIAGEDKDRRLFKAKDTINRFLLPHIGEREADMSAKAYFIGYMAHNLINTALGRRNQDDRDHYSNKRLDLAGPLIGNLFSILFMRMKVAIQNTLTKRLKANTETDAIATTVVKTIKNINTITSGLEYSIGTGNWSANRQAGGKAGVSQMLNRLTFMSTLSNLRRTNTPIGRDGKLTGPRHLHNTHWGYICPVETPEGQSCGLIKNLALMTQVTVSKHIDEGMMGILSETGTISISLITPSQIRDSTKVFINGQWYGINNDAANLMNRLRMGRRSAKIKKSISFVHNIADREIFIWSDGGRVTRPLLVVEDMHLRLNRSMLMNSPNYSCWKDFIHNGIIEYLDIDEEETRLIAMNIDSLRQNYADPNGIKTFTHCEIHPSLILGVCGSIIPFPDHNQSPRNTYQCAMGKQAIGLYAANFMIRMDSSSHVLWYPQKPLVTTRAMEYLNFKKLPAGINVVIAINCYTGYNQEDSLMLNSSSIDRGLFRSYFFRTYKETADTKGTDSENFMRPTSELVKGIRFADMSKVDDDGFALPGSRVGSGDVLIGKVSPDPATEQDTRRLKDTSVCVRPMESGVVDLVMRTTTKDNVQLARVRTRQMRRPEIGDKFSSRHGQKGVCGMTYRQEDMPFTRDGIVPDIIMNPHALPSRMTIGQLIECLLGKVTALCPETDEGDATPFNGVTVDAVASRLQTLGFEKYGNETLYNGRSGKRLKAKIYIGPTYYQRLKHMVGDKMHARSTGKTTLMMRQPVEGRSRNGGLRFGEMERDCLIAHGVAGMMRDRLLENSDRYFVTVCETCGLIAVERPDGTRMCPNCEDRAKLKRVELPYAFKLVLQELMSMCIAPRLKLVDD